jgi:hypothetical protein
VHSPSSASGKQQKSARSQRGLRQFFSITTKSKDKQAPPSTFPRWRQALHNEALPQPSASVIAAERTDDGGPPSEHRMVAV